MFATYIGSPKPSNRHPSLYDKKTRVYAAINAQNEQPPNQHDWRAHTVKDTDTTTQFLLVAVRDAIEHCVTRSHGDPKTYDYESDPKGYVASFISALRQWCDIHELQWEAELHEAEDLFEEHMWQTDGKSVPPYGGSLER